MRLVAADRDNYCDQLVPTLIPGEGTNGLVVCGYDATVCDLDSKRGEPLFYCDEHSPAQPPAPQEARAK